ncbi:hypothetical protein FACS189475_01980 [Betaproteobacteria bacterium]|nr:hypothetical protein FACS189475_01980 [Betaproteobacteria bacterium]
MAHSAIGLFIALGLAPVLLLSPNAALAADTTVTTGSFTNLYGNTGDASTPADATSNGNKLTLGDSGSGPSITHSAISRVSGGETATGTTNGTANNNQVIINAGTNFSGANAKWIRGGYVGAGSGTASNNTVTINQFTQGSGPVYVWGGFADWSAGAATGDVSGNGVTIGAGNTNTFGNIYGGESDSGALTSNTVSIAGGTTINGVYGGWGDTSANAGGSVGTANKVNITGGSAAITSVTGGQSESGFANYNEVNIESGYTGTISVAVNGGASSDGNAEYNKVTIAGGTLNSVRGGFSGIGAATHNEVIINGGTVNSDIHGGRTGDGSATNNTVSITTTGKTYRNIYGGSTDRGTTGDLFTGNTLNLATGNTITSVRNMAAINFTSAGSAGIATLDTTVRGAGGAPKLTLNTNTNEVTFGGEITGTGGIDKTGAGTLTLSSANTYSGLTTVQAGTLDVSGGSITHSSGLELYGGSTFIPNTGHTLDNKTLTVRGENATYDGNLSTQNATLNFIAPVNISQPMLNVTGNADVSHSVVNVGVSGGTALPMGTKLQLLNVTGTLSGAETLTEGSGIVESGVTTLYGLTLAIDPDTGNLVVGTITSGSATEQSKPFSEGYLGGVALLNQSGDAVAGEGMSMAVNSAQSAQSGYGAFAALAGGSLRYDTGSHINLNSATLLAGVSSSFKLALGNFTLGAFFEYGNGSYDTHNSFASGKVKGDGDLEHYGIGLLGRMDYQETARGNFYAEGSLRAGRIENDFGSSDIRDHNGRKAKYDSKSSYYSAHIGAGHVWKMGATANFDLYGKYYWTRQDKDKVRLSTGDPVKFKAIDSHRARIGGRYSRTLDVNLKGYAGLAWEHEFDGKARATANGFKIEAPKLKGNTGIAEIGLTLTPTPTRPLSLDLGIQAYTGRYEGVTGSIRAKYRF